jgi:hypothetical protein
MYRGVIVLVIYGMIAMFGIGNAGAEDNANTPTLSLPKSDIETALIAGVRNGILDQSYPTQKIIVQDVDYAVEIDKSNKTHEVIAEVAIEIGTTPPDASGKQALQTRSYRGYFLIKPAGDKQWKAEKVEGKGSTNATTYCVVRAGEEFRGCR